MAVAALIAASIVLLFALANAWHRWWWCQMRERVIREDVGAKWGCFVLALLFLGMVVLIALFADPESTPHREWDRFLPLVLRHHK